MYVCIECDKCIPMAGKDEYIVMVNILSSVAAAAISYYLKRLKCQK